MTSNSALKKQARRYAEEREVTYTEALRRVKHLKRGDRVRVTLPGVARWEGEVVADQTKSTVYVNVKRYSDGHVQDHPRDKLEFLERPS